MAQSRRKKGPFGDGIAQLCAVAAARTARELAKLVCKGRRHTPTLEVRLDWLRDDSERRKFLHWLKKWRVGRATLIATCRRRGGGGKFAGSAQAELAWLERARDAGCRWCDLEIETLRELPGKSLSDLRLPQRILLSLHDFHRVPRRLEAILASAYRGVAAIKIAAQCSSLADSLRMLRLARRSSNLVAVPMGEAGLPARILALREGSALAYAPVGEATAPGQVNLAELKNLYRVHALTDRTRIYGVIGNPVGHSLSPLLHNTAFLARKLDAVYLPFLVTNLRDFLRAIPDFGLSGFSVTIPHKESILRHLKDCDALAAEIGAVNTVVVRRDGSLFGCNTDYAGILRALEEKIKLAGSRALILGAGGAARAAAFALAKAGAHVLICARRESAARELAKAVGGDTLQSRALPTEFFDVILNATPVGMHPHTHASPLAPRELNCRVVMDLITRPERTQLLKLAASRGIATVSGVEMFIPQGIAQWELWTGQKAPEAAMRKAILQRLRSEEISRQHS
ncbi:MAG TPA: shikimate dehydrogenase [Candidatus Acidoferrum sp.]|nr:shikimate dehydrogenase [Candidatus Acidoferrum sp.]